MPDWLQTAFHGGDELAISLVLIRLAVSFALGITVGAIYYFTRRTSNSDAPSLVPTLVLLTILITMVTLAIGDSVARAFSLVGALAIVRFRTVVEDTRDTAFVIFAVAVGMAVGAGFVKVTLLGIPFVAVAAFMLRPAGVSPMPAAVPAAMGHSLTVRVGVGRDPSDLLRPALAKYASASKVVAIATVRQGAALEVTYRLSLRDEPAAMALVAELNGIEGVQSVELRAG